MKTRAMCVVVFAAMASCALGHVVPVLQERSVQTQAMVSSGGSSGDMAEATNFGPFVRTLNSLVPGAAGAEAEAIASQNSALTATSLTGVLGAHSAVRTGATFVTGESDAQSNLLFIFNFAAPTPVHFVASGQLGYFGRNPDGEPSDLSGAAGVRLLDGVSEDLIAGFQLFDTAGTNGAVFDGTLPAGQYVIIANARMHAFSADLLGPPARSGSGDASASFSLTVVPGPGTGVVGVLGMGVVGLRRRRR